MTAASRLSLVQWPYRGDLAYVSSTIRRRRLFTPTADTLSLPWISWCVTPLLGRRTVNTEPLPGSLATVTSPPIMRASLRVMASPSPVPAEALSGRGISLAEQTGVASRARRSLKFYEMQIHLSASAISGRSCQAVAMKARGQDTHARLPTRA
jgi:hypothetical protein